jgi:hypothetical protein
MAAVFNIGSSFERDLQDLSENFKKIGKPNNLKLLEQ